MNKTCTVGLLVAGILLTPALAQAAWIHIQPRDFTAGTDISHAIPGVTLSAHGNLPATPAVYAGAQSGVPGGNVFMYDTGSGLSGNWWFNGMDDAFLRMDFSPPATVVAVNFMSRYWQLSAYDSRGEFVASVAGEGNEWGSGKVAGPDIAYVEAGWAWPMEYCYILEAVAQRIPEPSSVVLTLVSLGGVGVACRRSRQTH